MDFILEVNNLVKSYGEVLAVNNISFGVQRGSLFAFLGPNGAGKSTTIKIITTLLQQNSGQVQINGQQDPNYIRHKIGVVFQDNVLDDLLTVKENLVIRGAFYLNQIDAIKRYDELADYLELREFENRKFKTLSGGQRRRVEIARALFSNPEILLLDEPTTGLDPETRQVVWRLIDNLKKDYGMTIFLTTHYMEEAANADYVVIIDRGVIVAQGTPASLKEHYSDDRIKIVPHNKAIFAELLGELNRPYTKIADQFVIYVKDAQDALDLIEKTKKHIKQFEVIKGTLDDVFIRVIGENHHA